MFLLCTALGVQHPDDLTLSPKQLKDWLWYNQEHGLGQDRDDDRAFAVLAAFGGEQKLVSTRWPYFKEQLTPEQLTDVFHEILELRERVNASRESKHRSNGSGSIR